MALFWSIVCPAALWATVGCTIGFILNAFPARDVLDRKKSLTWGAALLFFFIFWMVGMANA